jgi:MscS family membrane protein
MRKVLAVALMIGLSTPAWVGRAAETEAPPNESTPRGAVRGFLLAARDGDWGRAASFLDLRAVAPDRRAARGRALARQLKSALDRTVWVDVDALSTEPAGEADDGLPANQDRFATIETAKGPVDLLVQRPPGGDRWLIAPSTVARIPALYAEFGESPFAERLPDVLTENRLLEVALWQWIGLVALLFVTALVALAATRLVVRSVRVAIRRSATGWDETLAELGVGPLRLTIGVLIFSAAAPALALAVPVYKVVSALEKAVTIFAFTWVVVRVVDVVARAQAQRLAARGRAAATALVPMARRTAKVAIVLVAAVAALQNFGFDVTGIVAGLGIGGLAVALAAQKTVENLFGGFSLAVDQPVRVGDFCRFGDQVGTVEDVGLRSTRIRTLDRTVVTVPNAAFATMQLENFAVRDRIWLSTTIGLRYETTPDQLRWVLVEVKKLLLAHPKIHPDPARVRFAGFGASSLDLEIFAYVLTGDINEFLAVREDVFLRVMDVVAASGTGFAFPSQTIYAGADTGLDAEKSRKAEETVRTWRRDGRLPLPWMPSDLAAQVRGTLDYPPKGAAAG